MAKKKPKFSDNTIAVNKKARHDFFLEDTYEAGIALQGWEVKSLRAGKCQIIDTYVLVRDGEAWLLNARISPLETVSTHYVTNPTRDRKLLLNKKEIARLMAAINQDGKTAVCTRLYWKKHLVKAEICTAKGKQKHDKRQTEKERDWNVQKQRILRQPGRAPGPGY